MSTNPVPLNEMSDTDRATWAKFDAEIQKGLDDVEAGRLTDAETVFARLEEKYWVMGPERR